MAAAVTEKGGPSRLAGRRDDAGRGAEVFWQGGSFLHGVDVVLIRLCCGYWRPQSNREKSSYVDALAHALRDHQILAKNITTHHIF